MGLNGVGIETKHARIMNNDGRIFLVPQSAQCKMIFVNGVQVSKRAELRHLDRIIFGTSSVFIFKFPGHEDETNTPGFKDTDVDWDMCQQELIKHNGNLMQQESANDEAKLQEIEELKNEIEKKQQ